MLDRAHVGTVTSLSPHTRDTHKPRAGGQEMRRYLDARNRSKGARCVSGNAPPRAANQHSPPKANSLAKGLSSIFLGSSIASADDAGS